MPIEIARLIPVRVIASHNETDVRLLDPITQITTAAMLPKLASGIREAVTDVGSAFSELLQATEKSPETIPNLETSDQEAPSERSFFDSITERIRELLGNDSEDLGDTLHLDLSPLGQLYVLNDHPNAVAIQARLSDDQELQSHVRQWINSGGSDSLEIPLG